MSDPGSDHDLAELEARLESERPVPTARFRGDLRRSLTSRLEQRGAPDQGRRLVLAYASSGTVLLAIAAVGLLGLGPFAS